MFKVFAVLLASLTVAMNVNAEIKESQIPHSLFNMLGTPDVPKAPVDPELANVQVPIEKVNRKFNVSGVQCVWCSLESLARHNKESKLYDLTDKYKHGTQFDYVSQVLTAKGVKFKQVVGNKQIGVEFIKEHVTKKKLGAGIGLQGVHMINLVHYDEEKGIVKVIDNSGPHALKIQTWTIQQFNQLFDGWAITIFPPNHK